MAKARNDGADRHPETERPHAPRPIVPWDLLIESYHNGQRVILTLKETYLLFWRVLFAWLLPTDYYRFRVNGQEHRGYVCQNVRQRTLRFMLYLLHVRGHRWLTLHDMDMIDPGPDPITQECLTTRISRVNRAMYGKLPASLWPFIYVPKVGPGLPQPGYRLKPDCEILMVVDVAQGASCKATPARSSDPAPLQDLVREPNRDSHGAEDPIDRFLIEPVDWTIFLTPPEPETSGGAEQ